MKKRIISGILAGAIALSGFGVFAVQAAAADNTSYDKAYKLNLNSSISDSLFPKTNETDWYRIVIPEDGTLSVGMVSDNEKAYAYLNLYDRNASQRITYDSGRDKRLNITCNLQAGEYYVTVNCSDSMGYVLDNEFEAQAIENDSESMGTYQSANKISFGQTKTGHLGYISDTKVKDETDWYVFKLNSQDEVNIGLVGNTKAYIYLNLYDENGDKRIKYDSGRDKKLNVTKELEAGTYYIKVESSEAVGYTLTLNNASGDVATDSERVTAAPAATKKPIVSDETDTNAAGDNTSYDRAYKFGLNRSISGSLFPKTNETDWYRIVIPEDGTLSVGMVSDNEKAYAYLNLYDRNASQRITYDSGRDKKLNISCNLQAGEYYVTVNCSDSMGYVLDNEFEAQAIANDSENVGTYQSANKISFGQTKTGHLGYISDTNEKDESDWYVFNLNSQDEVNIGLVGNTNAYMYLNLYDENGDKRIKYDSGRDKKLNVTNELEAGMYYIKVESSEAVGYTLTLNNASGDVDTDSERVTAAPAATEKPAKVTEAPTATVKPAKTTQVPVPTTTKEPIKPASSVVVKDSLNVKQNSNKRLALDINGKSINFSDALPFIDGNGRTQIPIRAVAEAMGCTVDWNDSTKTVTITKDSTVIRLSINSLYIQVGNVTVTMDTTAQIVNDRTYIPIRFVGEALGMDVNWISSADTGL